MVRSTSRSITSSGSDRRITRTESTTIYIAYGLQASTTTTERTTIDVTRVTRMTRMRSSKRTPSSSRDSTITTRRNGRTRSTRRGRTTIKKYQVQKGRVQEPTFPRLQHHYD
eukprot:170131-Amphidinium_carterae.2